MEEKNPAAGAEELQKIPPKKGGLYAKVKMSVRSANILVAVLIVAMIAVTIYILNHNGFTVEFDTNGGSQIESVKVMHSEFVPETADPVKEGWVFTGWYTDPVCRLEKSRILSRLCRRRQTGGGKPSGLPPPVRRPVQQGPAAAQQWKKRFFIPVSCNFSLH